MDGMDGMDADARSLTSHFSDRATLTSKWCAKEGTMMNVPEEKGRRWTWEKEGTLMSAWQVGRVVMLQLGTVM